MLLSFIAIYSSLSNPRQQLLMISASEWLLPNELCWTTSFPWMIQSLRNLRASPWFVHQSSLSSKQLAPRNVPCWSSQVPRLISTTHFHQKYTKLLTVLMNDSIFSPYFLKISMYINLFSSVASKCMQFSVQNFLYNISKSLSKRISCNVPTV